MKLCSTTLSLSLVGFVGCYSIQNAPHHLPALTEMVVKVVIEKEGTEVSCGSAVLISCTKRDNDYKLIFLTSKHVVAPCKENTYTANVQFFEHTDQYCSKLSIDQIIDNPQGLDISILVVLSSKFYVSAEVSTSPLDPLCEVFSAGYPAGVGMVVTDGYLSFKHVEKADIRWLCSAPIFFGNSGGGVFSKEDNKLIGISVQILAPTAGIPVYHLHIFIPIIYLQDWIKDIQSK